MIDRNSTQSTGKERYTPDELLNKYGIQKAQYYERLKFVKVKAKKNSEGKAYLDTEQVAVLDALHEHVQATGKMEGFKFNSAGNETASELVAENTNNVDETAGKMTVSGKNELSQSKPNSIIEQEIPQTQPDFSDGMEQLFREAAETKAQNLAMPNLVKMQLVNQMTFDDLPEDLQNHVTKIYEAANPKLNPASIASKALEERRAAKLGGK